MSVTSIPQASQSPASSPATQTSEPFFKSGFTLGLAVTQERNGQGPLFFNNEFANANHLDLAQRGLELQGEKDLAHGIALGGKTLQLSLTGALGGAIARGPADPVLQQASVFRADSGEQYAVANDTWQNGVRTSQVQAPGIRCEAPRVEYQVAGFYPRAYPRLFLRAIKRRFSSDTRGMQKQEVESTDYLRTTNTTATITRPDGDASEFGRGGGRGFWRSLEDPSSCWRRARLSAEVTLASNVVDGYNSKENTGNQHWARPRHPGERVLE